MEDVCRTLPSYYHFVLVFISHNLQAESVEANDYRGFFEHTER